MKGVVDRVVNVAQWQNIRLIAFRSRVLIAQLLLRERITKRALSRKRQTDRQTDRRTDKQTDTCTNTI
jgi:hypothetical protein